MMTKNPDDIIRKLALSAGPESLKAIKAICAPMLGVAPAAAASFFAAMERDAELSLQRWVEGMAAKTLARDGVNAADKEAVTDFLEGFKSSFGKDGKLRCLAAIDTAVSIAVLAARYDEDIVKEVRRKGTERGRETAAENAKWRSEKIAGAFRKVAKRDKLPLMAGEKYIELHFLDKLGEFLPAGSELGKSRGLRYIVAKMKRGQL